ncbi:hypothetical protein [Bradyrhizobium diazoefficiens]|nr:hypothetical protein [Bradyrhizobium diazoefficiens]WLA73825.1 hypothetical protein QIH77_00885 [Bradyrhizobium diazoefficiens]
MAYQFTSLRYALERLLEAEHFVTRLVLAQHLEFKFELNAFLSAARSMTWVMQKAMARTQGFQEWYQEQQSRMAKDDAMRFFLQLRNISQKEGPVSYIGGSLPGGGWSYRFVGASVPSALIGKDISAACGDHLVKLATVLSDCADAFPFHSCPAAALTEEGVLALGISFADIEGALGLPAGWTAVAGIPPREKLRLLAREVDPLNRQEIARLVAGDFRRDGKPVRFPGSTGRDLTDDIAELIAEGDPVASNPRALFLKAIASRINEIDRNDP